MPIRHLYIIVSTILLFCLFSCDKQHKESYAIKGTLQNVNDSIFFIARETKDSIIVDTVNINHKGEFELSDQIDTLTIVSMYFRNTTASPFFLIDKDWKINIEGDINYPDLIVANGGEVNDELTKFKKSNAALLKERQDITKLRNSTEKGIISTVADNEDLIKLKNIDFDLLNIVTEYVKTNPSKISSVILIDNFFKNEEYIERLDESLDTLKGIAYDFPLAMQLRAYRDKVKKSAIGAAAPSLGLKDIDGEDISLVKMKGKYVLVSFMSTTCKVCQDMLPDMITEYGKLQKEKHDIEFITIVKDIEETPVSKENKNKTKWITAPAYGGWAAPVFEKYNIKEVPYNILISKDGKIVERDIPLHNIDSKLKELSGSK